MLEWSSIVEEVVVEFGLVKAETKARSMMERRWRWERDKMAKKQHNDLHHIHFNFHVYPEPCGLVHAEFLSRLRVVRGHARGARLGVY